MTIKVTAAGMIFGTASVSSATTGAISTAFVTSTSAIMYLRGTNGTNTLTSSKPYMSALVANTSFTLSNLGTGGTSANWRYMP